MMQIVTIISVIANIILVVAIIGTHSNTKETVKQLKITNKSLQLTNELLLDLLKNSSKK